MALNVGTLTALLKLDAGPALKEVQRASKAFQKLAKDMEQIGQKAAKFGAALTAPMLLALRTAAKHSPEVAAELDRVNRAFAALAGEIARAVLPLVRQFADGVASVAQWLRSMDPETRKAIFGFVEMAAKVALAVAAFGQLASFAGLAAKAFSLLLGPMGTVLATIAILVVAAAVVRQAWEDNLFGIQQTSKTVWAAMKDGVTDYAGWMSKQFHLAMKGAIVLLEKFASVANTVWGALHPGQASPFDGALETVRNIIKTVDEIPRHLSRDLQDGAKAVKNYVSSGVGHLVKDAQKALKGVFGALPNGKGLFGASDAEMGGGQSKLLADSNRFLGGIGTQGARSAAGAAHSAAVAKDRAAAMKEDAESWARYAQAVDQAASALKDQFISRLGTAAQVMGSAMQGMQAGGPWGALIAVFADLVTRSKQFSDALAYVETGLQMVADTFGRMFASGSKINEASNNLLASILEVVGPLFDAISEIAGILGPIINGLSAALKPILKIFLDTLKPALEGLGWILKVVATIVLTVIRSLATVWNFIIDAIAAIVRIFDGGAADALLKRKADTAAMDQSLTDLWSATTANTAAQTAQASAVDQATEALLNVPTGYKVALARLQAINTGEGGAAAVIGGGGGGGSTTNIYGPVTIAASDPEEIAAELAELKRKKNNRRE